MLIRRGYQSIYPGRRVQKRNDSGTNYVNVLCFFETRNAYMVSFMFFFMSTLGVLMTKFSTPQYRLLNDMTFPNGKCSCHIWNGCLLTASKSP